MDIPLETTVLTHLEEGEVEQYKFRREGRFTFTQDQLIEETHTKIPVTEITIGSRTPGPTGLFYD